MPTRISRLVACCCVAVTVCLLGLPEFPAFTRAGSTLFVQQETLSPAAQEPATVSRALPEQSTELRSDSPPVAPASSTEAPAAGTAARGQGRGVLVPLYVSFVALQALDTHSTLLAVSRGAKETNPIAAPFVEHPARLVAFKAGMTVGTLYLIERVRRHSRVGAIVLTAAINSAYATVVVNNYRVAASLPD
jgi:uncharacterized protein DUF5658